MRLVLDTNVWIDWLLFDDPAVVPIKAAHREGRIQIVVDEACLGELIAVLGYAEFHLDETQRNGHLAEVGRCTILQNQRETASAPTLPRCIDPDDQKFLELARDAAADWLLTRDKALLRLNRRLKTTGIRVASPADWSAARAQPADPSHSTQVVDSASLARAVR